MPNLLNTFSKLENKKLLNNPFHERKLVKELTFVEMCN